jgi:hypothetical protein
MRMAPTSLFIIFALSSHCAGAEIIKFKVSCEISGKVETGLDEQICAEIITVLQRSYPKFNFISSSTAEPPSLAVIIHNATRSGVGLHLKWQVKDGTVTEGKPMSISIMDKTLNATHRNSLYQRALAATPMPIPN